MRYIVEKAELRMAELYFEDALEEARKSECKKSQRGALIVKNGKIIGKGHNLVTYKKMCSPCVRADIHDNSRVELCSAVHAEQMAIIYSTHSGPRLNGGRMYQAELKDGEMRHSGDPSCTVCSRMLYTAGVELALRHKEGIAVYSPKELNELSFKYVLKNR